MLNEDGSPVPQEPVAPVVPERVKEEETPDYSNPNDLDFEMSEEQEKEYVEQILKSGNYTPEEKSEPEKPAEPVKEEPKTPEAPVVPEPVKEEPKVEIPAEITVPQTDDLWIEVEKVVTDDLGEEKIETVKLTYDPGDPSSFIPDDFTAKNTKQLAEIMDAKNEMAVLYKERQAEFDTVKAADDAKGQEKALLDSWDQEIADLIKSGVLEEPKAKLGDADYLKDPSILKTEEVFKFMAAKNEERVKNNEPVIRSFSLALSMYQNDADRKAAEEKKKQDDADTKKKGALVGGGSAASGGSPEPKAYKAGSHNSIWSVPVED